MSIPAGEDVEFSPNRPELHWSQTQFDNIKFAAFNHVQVAQYGDVRFFQQPCEFDDENTNGVNGECELCFNWSILDFLFPLFGSCGGGTRVSGLETDPR